MGSHLKAAFMPETVGRKFRPGQQHRHRVPVGESGLAYFNLEDRNELQLDQRASGASSQILNVVTKLQGKMAGLPGDPLPTARTMVLRRC